MRVGSTFPPAVPGRALVAGWALLGALVCANAAAAAQTDVTISMAAPAAAPAIHSPGVIGWNPSTPFLHGDRGDRHGAPDVFRDRPAQRALPWTRARESSPE